MEQENVKTAKQEVPLSEESAQEKNVSETVETEEEIAKRKKRDMIFEMALFLILGTLLGITIKTEAVKRITIGFNDYQMPAKAQRYDVESLKKNLLRQLEEQQTARQPVEE